MTDVGYDQLSSERATSDSLELQAHGENLEAVVAALPCLPGTGARVLEVGCGTGALSRLLSTSLGPGSTVTGIDVSVEHVDAATRLSPPRPDRSLTFHRLDLFDERCRPVLGTFDLVFCRYVLMYELPRGRAVDMVRRMASLTRRGGRVASVEADVDFGAERFPPAPEPLATGLRLVVPHYRRTGQIEWRAGLQVFSTLRHAGCTDVGVSIADARVIAGGRPRQLVAHDSQNVAELLGPCLAAVGLTHLRDRMVEQWHEYLAHPDHFLATPVYVGSGTWTS